MKRPVSISKNSIVELITAFLIIYFIYGAILSTIRIQSQKNLLGFYTYYKDEIAWAIIFVNAVTGLLLIIPKTRVLGLGMSLIFMTLLGLTIWLTPGYPHDFEGILNYITNKQKTILVIAGIFLSALGLVLSFRPRESTKPQEQTPIVYT